MAIIIDGKAVSAQVRAELKSKTEALVQHGIQPGLAVVLVGDDSASKVYVGSKKRACAEIGYYSSSYELPSETSQQQLLELIDVLNGDDKIHGILVQLPLPSHIDEKTVINSIAPHKDVDAFHPQNVGKIMIGDFDYLPCTPAGVMALLDYYDIDVSGRDCVVVGRSNIVGKPQSMLLLHKNATVQICHSGTKNLAQKTKAADILISAVGKADFITADMVKEGAVVIDVGMNRNDRGKLCGDVCFDEVYKLASYITPVPGGVGPMTIAMLMQNTYTAARLYSEKKQGE